MLILRRTLSASVKGDIIKWEDFTEISSNLKKNLVECQALVKQLSWAKQQFERAFVKAKKALTISVSKIFREPKDRKSSSRPTETLYPVSKNLLHSDVKNEL